MKDVLQEQESTAATEAEETLVPADGDRPEPKGKKIRNFLKGKKGKKRRMLILLLIVVVIVLALVLRGFGKKKSSSEVTYTTAAVETRDISESLSGSGTLEPANSYTVTTLVEGDVLSADFEEGDTVEKDAILCKIDSSDSDASMEKAQISLDQSQRNYENALKNATVTAGTSGTVYSLDVKVGDDVKTGQTIATIQDSSVMTLTVPFPSDDAADFYVGEAAAVTLDSTFETLSGKITEVSGSDQVLTGNRIVRNVTVQVANPGGLTDTQSATAAVGSVGCAASGTLSYKAASIATASSSGTVSAINAPEGSRVSKGDTIVTLSGDSLDDSIQSAEENVKNAQISLDNQNDQLANYTITSPIDGTIIDKSVKTGDKVKSGDTVCTVYDLSYLTMTMNIDELDISKVAVGQTVEITADAVEGSTYEGKITKVSVAGTTSNGTTTYPVTVEIDDTDGLLPGMNVNAEIVIAESKDSIAIPSAAVSRGNLVLITADSPSAGNAVSERTAPDGYVYVKVETGVSDDSYIAVTSGLQDGDTVAYVKQTSDDSTTTQQTGGFLLGGGGGEARRAASGYTTTTRSGSYSGGGFSGGGDAGGPPSGGGPNG